MNPYNLSNAEMSYLEEGIKYILPWPPSINHYYATFKGRRILSRAGREYKKTVAAIVMLNKQPKLSGKLAVDLILNEPNRIRRDIDNVVKPLLDSLTVADVYTDDSLIRKLHVEFGEVVPLGAVQVSLRNY